jgi:hypothetical protein
MSITENNEHFKQEQISLYYVFKTKTNCCLRLGHREAPYLQEALSLHRHQC